METLEQLFNRTGVFQHGIVNTAEIRFTQEVRAMCEVNTCQRYGKAWSCPPGLGTVDECQKRIQRYDKMLVFTVKYDLEDSFDYEGMTAGMTRFKQTCREIDAALKPYLKDYLILSNEGCDLCKECTYPDAPCRFPDRAHGSIEGYGIFVSELAKQAGVNYINGENTVTYFGAIVYHNDALACLC